MDEITNENKQTELEQSEQLERLERRINSAKAPKTKKLDKNYNKSTNILIELCAAIIVGLLIGWSLDAAFDTKPIGMILCIIFSFLAVIKKLAM